MSNQGVLHSKDAKQLADVNKTEPIWENSTPRWLLQMLDKKGIENTSFRINKVNSINNVTVDGHEYESIVQDSVQLNHQPVEIDIVPIETLIKIPSKVYDIMNYPHNQMHQQLKLTIENLYEHQERYFINNSQTGLVAYCSQNGKIKVYGTSITPDIMDELLTLVWIKPTFYLMHPSTLTDFCKSCNSRGLNTGSMELFGYQFVTWRGLPIITSDKIQYEKGKQTHVFLIRTGVSDSGVVQLYNMAPTKSGHAGIFTETSMTDNVGTVNTRVTLYTNIAVLSDDAVAGATCGC